MGVINVTPDSFSDGGRYSDTDAAVIQAQNLLKSGADVLDIGGESTRPGADQISLDEELSRVLPLIAALKPLGAKLSIDTQKPEVAQQAVESGVEIWNDVSALSAFPQALAMAAELECDVILMHGYEAAQDLKPGCEDTLIEVCNYLVLRAEAAQDSGVKRHKIWLDPGIGFGKDLEQNLELIRHSHKLSQLGYPLLMAASRKRFIAALEQSLSLEPSSAQDRLGGSLASHLYALDQGAHMVRVHDVYEMAQAMRVWKALRHP